MQTLVRINHRNKYINKNNRAIIPLSPEDDQHLFSPINITT